MELPKDRMRWQTRVELSSDDGEWRIVNLDFCGVPSWKLSHVDGREQFSIHLDDLMEVSGREWDWMGSIMVSQCGCYAICTERHDELGNTFRLDFDGAVCSFGEEYGLEIETLSEAMKMAVRHRDACKTVERCV